MPSTHPKWKTIAFATQGDELKEALASPTLRLVHAWGNIIWTDGNVVYKLTRPDDGKRCHASLVALKSILTADPTFPTIAPASFTVQQAHLPSSGTWLITVWPFVALGRSDHTSTASYRALGTLLARLHSIEVPHLPRHDPLQWASARIDVLARSREVSELRGRMAELQDHYLRAFHEDAHVTVHGDMHWEQTATEDGKLRIMDFETTARGPRSTDLIPSAGWIKRTGQPNAAQMRALRAGYGREWPELSSEQEEIERRIAAFSKLTWQLLYDQKPNQV